MVRDNDAVDPLLDSTPGIIRMLNALEDETPWPPFSHRGDRCPGLGRWTLRTEEGRDRLGARSHRRIVVPRAHQRHAAMTKILEHPAGMEQRLHHDGQRHLQRQDEAVAVIAFAFREYRV